MSKRRGPCTVKKLVREINKRTCIYLVNHKEQTVSFTIKTHDPYMPHEKLELIYPGINGNQAIKRAATILDHLQPYVDSDDIIKGFLQMFQFNPSFIPPKLHKDEYYRVSSKGSATVTGIDGAIVKVISVEIQDKRHVYKLRVSCSDRGRYRPREITVYDDFGKHDILDIFVPLQKGE